ncbi:MAG: hypothetical protein VB031_05345 [Eubacteriaceae bacterium]|nr:hypothetical protein [Eubacteriaceae bacterium]
MEQPFSVVFFRLYDRKLQAGEITFKEIGISKNDFTKLCTDKTFVPERETVERLCETMKLAEKEIEEFIAAAERQWAEKE